MSDVNDRLEKQMEGTNLALAAVAEVLQKMDDRLSKAEEQEYLVEAARYEETEMHKAQAEKTELVKAIATEVLDVMKDLASRDITMIVVTHEMGFAKEVADRCILFDEGHLIEENTPHEFFDNPKHDRTKLFLKQIL